MRPIHLFTTLVAAAFVLQSCEDRNSLKEESISDYANLKIGNYWVYEERVEGSGDVYYDSVSVGDTEIYNGREYFVVTGHSIGSHHTYRRLLRDSSNFIVDNHRNIYLTKEMLNQPVQQIKKPEYELTSFIVKETDVVVSGKSYTDVLNRKEEVHFLQPTQYTTTNDNQFASGVGLIRETGTLWTSKKFVERRLVRHGKR